MFFEFLAQLQNLGSSGLLYIYYFGWCSSELNWLNWLSSLNCSDLTHPTNKISPQKFFSSQIKKFLFLPPKNIFYEQFFLCMLERTDFLPKEKLLINYLKKQYFKLENISDICLKKNLTFIWKNNIFQMKIIFYNYLALKYLCLFSNSYCFSSSERLLYHSQPHCGFYFSSLERRWYLSCSKKFLILTWMFHTMISLIENTALSMLDSYFSCLSIALVYCFITLLIINAPDSCFYVR